MAHEPLRVVFSRGYGVTWARRLAAVPWHVLATADKDRLVPDSLVEAVVESLQRNRG